eukprot:CAMPEP_0175221588 /NCGR_PEP_ID=MMETSP0093-20121207/20383_1 /TAXON_ID=311494 /ORGANISM="Alexandrium monilatum, Strain CCMP3105" /LENGTH=445 /DNA_ID=CAMNT_0016515143 /DNA_START=44 /DNA_END=1378 /DNA_ORIENTATION=+
MTILSDTDAATAASGRELRDDDPFNTVTSDGEELAVPACSFSDSEDEVRPCGRVETPAVERPLGMDELREHFRQSLVQLAGVRRHNHRDRDLAALPASTLAPPQDILDSGGPLPRIDVAEVSAEEFSRRFSRTRQPAMLLGAANDWRATQRWSSREELLDHYGDVRFKVTEIVPPYACGKPLKVELPLRLYVQHAEEVGADFPFYVFERDLEGPRLPLLEDFTTPAYFRDDLYDLTEYTRAFFPLYRYYVIGVERTGSNLHVDPSCTSAWNTLLCGLKRWVLFPPGDSEEYRSRIGASCRTMGGDAQPPAYWWLDTLPALRESGAAEELGMLECVQRPGETIFVPFGWWHAVLNIGFTAAVTQNLLAPDSLDYAWPTLAADWPDFVPRFARFIQEHRPEVELPAAARAAADEEAQRGGEDSEVAEGIRMESDWTVGLGWTGQLAG